MFIGQGSIRDQVIGPVNRKATPDEIEKMIALVRQGMEQGAFGLSSGLFYVPGTFTPTAEVVELAKAAGRMGGIYISHMRDEAGGILDSVRETIEIGEKGGLPTQVTHHKIIGTKNWGRSVDSLKLVDEARARGVDATIDQYPYTASSTSIQAALMPAWGLEGGREAILKRLATPSMRSELQKETRASSSRSAAAAIRTTCSWRAATGIPRLRASASATSPRGAASNRPSTTPRRPRCGSSKKAAAPASSTRSAKTDLQRILRHPATMIGSDGEIPIFGEASPHPRSYGTFARVLGRYVRELKVISLEEAVRKMAAFPAQRIGLADRGVLREGMKADIAIFDLAAVRDLATFERPHQYAEGVTQVIVNGQVAFEDGKMTVARPGRVLLGPSAHP
jgi:dihydroorotase/N-acyl-D-amino-acid deacylase